MEVSSAVSSSKRRRTPMANAQAYGRLTRGALYALFFLLPLFFLPWTTEVFELNKQVLLVVLTLVATMAWIGSMVMEKRLLFRTGWLNLLPLLVIVGTLLSSVFSLAGYQSWVGQASQEYASFLTTLMFVFLFYVITNTASEPLVRRGILTSFFLSATLSGILTTLVALGISPFGLLPGFNTVGTINTFAIFMSFTMLLGMGLWIIVGNNKNSIFSSPGKAKIIGIMIGLVVLMTLLTLLAIDFWVLWVINIVGVLLLMVFGFIQQKELANPRLFVVPLLILLLSVLFIFVRSPIHLRFPIVVSPGYASSWNITSSVLHEGPKSLLLGSGPGTFTFDYAKYRSTQVNATTFWNTRFDRSKSHAMTTLATLGIVGLTLWIVFVGWIELKTLGFLLKRKEEESWNITAVLYIVWSALTLATLLYSSSLTLQFLFWTFSALLASQILPKTKETDFSRSPKLGLVFSFAFVVVSVGVLAVLFITGQRYVSEIAFAKAVQLDRRSAPPQEIVQSLGQAVSANSLSDIYYRNLSQGLLLRVSDVLKTVPAGQKPSQEQLQQIQGLVSASINAAARATALGPNNVLNWTVRGTVYQELMSLVNNAEDLAVASFARAAELEPNNPIHLVNQARIHLTVADRAKTLKNSDDKNLGKQAADAEVKELAVAEQELMKATSLKGDYAVAHYYLAAVYERQGRLKEAAVRLEALRNYAPLDVGIGFQLGLMYARLQNYDLAKAELERVVGLAPKYADAHWYLASIYEAKGDLKSAIEQVQAVLDTNPDNKAVITRLVNLKAGKTTASLPSPVEEGEKKATSVDSGEIIQNDSEDTTSTDQSETTQP